MTRRRCTGTEGRGHNALRASSTTIPGLMNPSSPKFRRHVLHTDCKSPAMLVIKYKYAQPLKVVQIQKSQHYCNIAGCHSGNEEMSGNARRKSAQSSEQVSCALLVKPEGLR